MIDALEVVIPNHPEARKRTQFDSPMDIKVHDWIHTNIKFVGTPKQYANIYTAFKSVTPFILLDYKAQPDCPTNTINRWSVRECPVAKYDGDSLWVALESKGNTPHTFLQHVADTQAVKVIGTHVLAYSIKWQQTVYTKGKPPLTNRYGRQDNGSPI